MKKPKINAERIKYRMEELGKIGRDPAGGWTRFSFSQEDAKARELISSFMKEAGLITRTDVAGNLFGRREGTLANGGAVASGSHIDTVRNGGLFDGNAGVICALEVAQVLADAKITHKAPYEVIVFAEEEGGRFGSTLFGSRALAGQITPEYLKNQKDENGMTQWDAMENFGLSPGEISSAKLKKDQYQNFFELHIEQGNILESSGDILGVVEGIVGITWLGVTIEGLAAHAGATPMGDLRRDALAAASEVVLAIEKAAIEAGSGAVATVGQFTVLPSAVNVISGQVDLKVDIRAIEQNVIDRLAERISQDIAMIANKRGVDSQVNQLVRIPPTRLSASCIGLIEEKIVQRKIPYQIMPSGAGHDSQVMAGLTDVGMIFVPSKRGISHSPLEDTDWQDLAIGAQVLLDVILARLES